MSTDTTPAFRPLDGIYEPSAVQQLPDGRFLVVEDQKRNPFSVFTIDASGKVASSELTPSLLHIFSSDWKLSDLEGLALDQAGFLYAITSHSRDGDGNEEKSREKLIRFRVDGDHVVDSKVVTGLKRALTQRHPVLAEAAAVHDVKAVGGLNIEAMELAPDQRRLLIGFRGPLVRGHAVVASLENVAEVFDSDAEPVIAPELEELDLGGRGIRGMSYVPSLGEFVVIGGPLSKADEACGLWLWKGTAGAPARRVEVPGVQGFAHAEGVSPATIDGVERLVIVSDEGDREAGRNATYLLLDPRLLVES